MKRSSLISILIPFALGILVGVFLFPRHIERNAITPASSHSIAPALRAADAKIDSLQTIASRLSVEISNSQGTLAALKYQNRTLAEKVKALIANIPRDSAGVTKADQDTLTSSVDALVDGCAASDSISSLVISDLTQKAGIQDSIITLSQGKAAILQTQLFSSEDARKQLIDQLNIERVQNKKIRKRGHLVSALAGIVATLLVLHFVDR